MEKHLDMLVDNTERLTKILARRDPAEGSGCNETKVSHAAKDSMENLVSEDDDDNDDDEKEEEKEGEEEEEEKEESKAPSLSIKSRFNSEPTLKKRVTCKEERQEAKKRRIK